MSRGELSRELNLAMDRRRFIARLGALGAGSSLLGIVAACGGDSPTSVVAPSATGTVNGSVVHIESGEPQHLGRIYLLAKSGLNSGSFVDVSASGTYDFGAVPVGEYQLRFWGSNLATVPYPAPNPVRITVAEHTPTVVQFEVDTVVDENPDHDVYIGDYFFQDQPSGAPNGTIVAKLGTTICWYNVGTMIHSVTGGPWGDSGPIGQDGNFNWVSDQVGTFQYRCRYHGTQMIATLQITA